MKIMTLCLALLLTTVHAYGWEARVVAIMQHGDYVAVTLSPDPGKLQCEIGSPYLLKVDNSVDKNQKFSLLLTAMVTDLTISGFDDGCSDAIWGQTRPLIERLNVKKD